MLPCIVVGSAPRVGGGARSGGAIISNPSQLRMVNNRMSGVYPLGRNSCRFGLSRQLMPVNNGLTSVPVRCSSDVAGARTRITQDGGLNLRVRDRRDFVHRDAAIHDDIVLYHGGVVDD